LSIFKGTTLKKKIHIVPQKSFWVSCAPSFKLLLSQQKLIKQTKLIEPVLNKLNAIKLNIINVTKNLSSGFEQFAKKV